MHILCDLILARRVLLILKKKQKVGGIECAYLMEILNESAFVCLDRDAYGFAVRPQHVQRYREYANIYKVLLYS